MFKLILLALLVIVAPIAMAQTNSPDQAKNSKVSALPEGLKLEKATNPVIMISTQRGDMVLELFPDSAPKHVESMLNLIKKGFYNGLIFHRVIAGFVIQGGCPEGTGMGGPGYTLPAEFNKRNHLKGTLAMARSQNPNSAGSQFYICLAPQPHLDGSYTVFGQLRSGEDVPDKIRKGDKMNITILQDLAPAK